jgi:hypothetical protein
LIGNQSNTGLIPKSLVGIILFIHETYKIKFLLWQLLFLVISTALFSLILANRSPNLLRPISMALRTGFGLVIPITGFILYLAFRIPNRTGNLIGMAVTLSIFAMPLAGLWASGQSQSTVLSGLILLFDADSYYIDAQIIDGAPFQYSPRAAHSLARCFLSCFQ